jgi:hypothetical protein
MINSINIDELKLQFINNNRKYIIIDDLFNNDFIKQCESDFLKLSDTDFIRYSNEYFEYEKYALNSTEKMTENLRVIFDYIHSSEFIETICRITNFEELLCDENRWGGGLHKTKKGGYLSIHKDFNILPTSYKKELQLERTFNLIGYISSDWFINNNGSLEFWDDESGKSAIKIENKFNRWILFDTRDCYHGHPHPFKGENRISIASYYYTEKKTESDLWSSTEYLKLPWMDESEEYILMRKERANHKKRYKTLL